MVYKDSQVMEIRFTGRYRIEGPSHQRVIAAWHEVALGQTWQIAAIDVVSPHKAILYGLTGTEAEQFLRRQRVIKPKVTEDRVDGEDMVSGLARVFGVGRVGTVRFMDAVKFHCWALRRWRRELQRIHVDHEMSENRSAVAHPVSQGLSRVV